MMNLNILRYAGELGRELLNMDVSIRIGSVNIKYGVKVFSNLSGVHVQLPSAVHAIIKWYQVVPSGLQVV